jgi:hypothetical protein
VRRLVLVIVNHKGSCFLTTITKTDGRGARAHTSVDPYNRKLEFARSDLGQRHRFAGNPMYGPQFPRKQAPDLLQPVCVTLVP